MVLKLSSGFEVLRVSDLAYNEMTVEVQFDGEQIFQINMDSGFENLEIEWFKEYLKPNSTMKFKLKELLEVLEISQKILEEYAI